MCEFNEKSYYLGKLCKYGHEFENTGKSLRFKVNSSCKECTSIRYSKWKKSNPGKFRTSVKNWEKNHLEKVSQILKRAKLKRKENGKESKYRKEYFNLNRIRININRSKRRNRKILIDPQYKMECDLRRRLIHAIKRYKTSKKDSTFNLTGCTKGFLIKYLEELWKPGMSWANYGGIEQNRWVVDHKIPICSFDKSDPDWQFKAFHYTNLQPLWYRENLVKIKEDLKLMV